MSSFPAWCTPRTSGLGRNNFAYNGYYVLLLGTGISESTILVDDRESDTPCPYLLFTYIRTGAFMGRQQWQCYHTLTSHLPRQLPSTCQCEHLLQQLRVIAEVADHVFSTEEIHPVAAKHSLTMPDSTVASELVRQLLDLVITLHAYTIVALSAWKE